MRNIFVRTELFVSIIIVRNMFHLVKPIIKQPASYIIML